MNTIIVSDLHIGCRYFLSEVFERFLETTIKGYDLILNGDIIDDPKMELPPSHQVILNLIRRVSHNRRVVWILGNHDNGYLPEGFERVQFKRIHSIKKKLLITHGDDFDEIMPRNQAFIKAFKLMHNLRIKIGARPVHVAYYAKKWKIFYRYLRKNVMRNAVRCAVENGYEAVTCGHTHYPEQVVLNGIQYINTGAWTEFPACYLVVTPDKIVLKTIHGNAVN